MTVPLYSVVRSFDFARQHADGKTTGVDVEGEDACYAEGVVCAFIPGGERFVPPDDPEDFVLPSGCDRYAIRVTRRVFRGEEIAFDRERWVAPPVNGTMSHLGSPTAYVQVICPPPTRAGGAK